MAVLETTQTIHPGEEVFVDYGPDYAHFTD